jgi:hypothetical protein
MKWVENVASTIGIKIALKILGRKAERMDYTKLKYNGP